MSKIVVKYAFIKTANENQMLVINNKNLQVNMEIEFLSSSM